jgi:hypothetical protein
MIASIPKAMILLLSVCLVLSTFGRLLASNGYPCKSKSIAHIIGSALKLDRHEITIYYAITSYV